MRALFDPADGRGGLAVRLDDRHHYELEVASGRARLVARIGPLRTVVASRSVATGPVVLTLGVAATLAASEACSGPDTLSFGVEEPDGTVAFLGTLDGRYLSTEVAGGFTGRVIGMYAAAGTVHCDWFDYEPVDASVQGE